MPLLNLQPSKLVMIGTYEVNSAYSYDGKEIAKFRRLDMPGENAPWTHIESFLHEVNAMGSFKRGDVWALALVRSHKLTPGESPQQETSTMIRAKFDVTSVSQEGDNEVVHAIAATSGDENKDWARYTPAGNLNMTIGNPAAQGKLIAGKSYYLDIHPVEDAPAEGEDVGTATGDERTDAGSVPVDNEGHS